MTYTNSLIAITPLPMADIAETMGVLMGHSGHEFTVPLYTGSDMTHRALHAWVTDTYADYWRGLTTPDGIDPDAAAWTLSQLVVSVAAAGTSPRAHFEAVLAANGLAEIEAEI